MADKPALLPAYLIVGPDELKRKQAVARLRARVDGPFSAFNLEELVASGDLEPVGVLASLNSQIRDFVLIGNLAQLPQCKRVFDELAQLYGVQFHIPEYAEFSTAIGAALSHFKN